MWKNNLLISLFAGIHLLGCAEKAAVQSNINLAGNRQMAVAFRSIKSADGSNRPDANYFSKLTQKAVAATYGSKVTEITLEPNAPLESPEHLFQIGKYEVDDLFVVDGTLKGNFEIPTTTGDTSSQPDPSTAPVVDTYAEFSVSIFNGSNLRAVNIFTFRVPTNPAAAFEMAMATAFKKASLSTFPNPNIYPKGNPKHFAELLYTYSEAREKDVSTPLTCDNAPDRLRYYSAAKTLYDVAESRENNRVDGTQADSLALATKRSESAAKAKIVEDCLADQAKTYDVRIDYGSINATSQVFIQKNFETSNFNSVLKQYTSKPVVFKFQVESDGHLSLFIELRFDQAKYRGWTSGRIPSKLKNLQVLSLDPYYALMQKLVLFKNSLPESAPFALRSAFDNMKMMLNLKTLINGEVAFAVDGKYIKDQKRLAMAYPNTLFISIPGFDTRSVANRDAEIFQEKGWIALGNCKTIEGIKTEDGLLYDFFGFPCQ